MKRKLLFLVLCGGLLAATSTAATAASGEAQFLGVVANGTCDIHVEVNGVRTNLINFGTVPASGVATTDAVGVPFKFKPDESSPACSGLGTSDRINMSWNFSSFSRITVSNDPLFTYGVRGRGKASEAFVVLAGLGGRDWVFLGGTNTTVSNNGDELLTGLNYTASFFPGTVPGDFHAAAAWVVSYE